MVTITNETYAAILARQKNAIAKKLGLTHSKIVASAKRSKYGSVKTNGYDSKREYAHSVVLEAMKRNGEISNLRKQVPFVLQESFLDKQGKLHRSIKYLADFVFEKGGEIIVHEVKSAATKKKESYRIKRKLFAAKYPEILFYEIL